MKSIALKFPPIRRLWESRNALLEERDRLLSEGTPVSSALPDDHMQVYQGYGDHQLAIFQEFQRDDLQATPGFLTDFIGTRFETDILWSAIQHEDGRLFGPPIPADFHAEAIEWIGVLNAAKEATKSFTVIELGAGFGTWAICSAVAARLAGCDDFRIYMVEGDPRHCENARRHFVNNGFDPDDHHIISAAVGVEDGKAYWPKPEGPASSDGWNNRPMSEGEGDYLGRDTGELMEVDVVSLRSLLDREPYWDLIHMDIQGHEVDVTRSCLDLIGERVRRIVVGTHSRKVDGDYMAMMYEAGWVCENEKPARIVYNAGAATLEGMTIMDGTQVWRNPML